ncbi:MAG: hypothetical protein AAFZ07_19660 [Actinomycetota bacterium]
MSRVDPPAGLDLGPWQDATNRQQFSARLLSLWLDTWAAQMDRCIRCGFDRWRQELWSIIPDEIRATAIADGIVRSEAAEPEGTFGWKPDTPERFAEVRAEVLAELEAGWSDEIALPAMKAAS